MWQEEDTLNRVVGEGAKGVLRINSAKTLGAEECKNRRERG